MSVVAQDINALKNQAINEQLLEKVIISNDLGGLSPIEKVKHITKMCESLGLNPLTKPIQLIKFQGREIAYFSKDATEQLRKINKVSVLKLDTKIMDGGIYVVTATAATPDGRQDQSTAAIVISGLKGDALANAIMKCETKAKRRVTLSICGLGFLDESELDTMKGASPVPLYQVHQEPIKNDVAIDNKSDDESIEVNAFLEEIKNCQNMDSLRTTFMNAMRHAYNFNLKEKLIDAKNLRKEQLENSFECNENGEILQ